MADSKKPEPSYFQEILHFYFAPGLRSVATTFYLVVFGYFSFYYIDSLFLALRFLWHLAFGSTALQGIPFMLSGMAFVLCLVLPFSVSLYSIFVMHTVWSRSSLKTAGKWLLSILVVVGSLFIIMITDEGARLAARQPSMQSFIEDAGLVGRI